MRFDRAFRASALLLLLPALGHGQAPRRPRLARDADTNDAVVYFRLGLDRLVRNPNEAAAAFHWAARLDPASAQVYYSQAVAILVTRTDQVVAYLQNEPSAARSTDVRRADSLFRRANMEDPFLQTGLTEVLLVRYVRGLLAQQADYGVRREFTEGDIARSLDTVLAEYSPEMRAELEFGRGQFQAAVRYFNRALARRRAAVARIQSGRARAFWHLGQLDSAHASILTALEHPRPEAQDSGLTLHESQALREYMLGRILERRRDAGGARAAYQRAVELDLAWFPAHVRLGSLAFQRGDTAGAIAEFRRAALVKEDDYYATAALGVILHSAGRSDSAATVLARAVQLEPLASMAWLIFARAADAANQRPEAIRAFERFLTLAPRDDRSRLAATARLAQLRAAP